MVAGAFAGIAVRQTPKPKEVSKTQILIIGQEHTVMYPIDAIKVRLHDYMCIMCIYKKRY
jgi:hypothetical protein